MEASSSEPNDWAAIGLLADANRNEIHDALVGGKKLPEIKEDLLRQGINADTAEALILGVAGTLVKSLVIGGVSPHVINNRLVGYGLDDVQMQRVQAEVMGKHERQLQSAGILSGKRFEIGAGCFGIAIVLIVLSRLGFIPLGFRPVGWLLLLIGSLVIGYHHLIRHGFPFGYLR